MKKATHETDRASVKHFQQIINIGPSIADDFRRLGLKRPAQLIDKDPWKLYKRIAKVDGHLHDPCVLDCFMSAVDFMNGNPPRKWWEYTKERKRTYSEAIEKFRRLYE